MSYQVKKFMYLADLYVKSDDSLHSVNNLMEKYDTNEVFVVDDKNELYAVITKNQLLNYNSKFFSNKNNNICVKDVIGNSIKFLSVYPQNNVVEVRKIMTQLNIKYLPVCKSSNNRQLIGFIRNSDI